MAFFSSRFASEDPQEIEARLTEQADRVALHGRTRYVDSIIGDESFTIAREVASAPVVVEGTPADVVVSYADASAPWWSGTDGGDLIEGPVLFGADRELRVRGAAGGAGTSVTFERRRFHALARAYFGQETKVRLAEARTENSTAGEFWKQLVGWTRLVPLERPLVRANAYRAVAFAVLDTFGVVASRSEASASVRRRFQQFQQAQEYLEAHAHRAIGVDDAAVAVGTSVQELRRLFLAFSAQGHSPEHHLRERRVIGAHDELVRAAPGTTTVQVVAARWGFAQPGTFVRLHIEQYREAPHLLLE